MKILSPFFIYFSVIITTILVSLLLLGNQNSVDAWSCEGHAVIIAIAQQWLHVNVRSREYRNIIDTYFNPVTERALAYDGHPMPRVANTNKKKVNGYFPMPIRTSISTAGCLADDLRSAPENKEKWSERNRWHFEDEYCYPISDSAKCLKKQNGESGGLLVSSLEKILENLMTMSQNGALAAGTPQAAEDFAYLLHLVGDIHQPLHFCSSAGKEFRKFYSEKHLEKFQQEASLAEEFDDEASDDEIVMTSGNNNNLNDENSISKKSNNNKSRKDAKYEPTDRGGNFWCIDGNNKKSSSTNDLVVEKSSSSPKKQYCKKSLHRFYDSVGGFIYDANLKSIINGSAFDTKLCEGCPADEKDIECCLEPLAKELMQYAFDHGDTWYYRQLKRTNMNPVSWLEDHENLCKSTKFDKIRKIDISSQKKKNNEWDDTKNEPLEWKDGEALIPGEKLSEEYKLWAKDLLKKRLVLAGFRLGFVLREFYNNRLQKDVPRWVPKN